MEKENDVPETPQEKNKALLRGTDPELLIDTLNGPMFFRWWQGHAALAKSFAELSATIGPDLADADWHRQREVIRTLVQRIEIGHEIVKIVFRVSPDAGRSGPESIAVTLPR